jgi:energy-coupling factor transporter ATP-binding protein EcfA2
MLTLDNVTYRYPGAPRASLGGVSLTLGPGEVVGVVGPTESGKSTLCLVAAGLAPRSVGGMLVGQVAVDERSLSGVPAGETAGLVGIAFAGANLSGVCSTVYEEVAFGPMNLGVERAEVMARTERALAAVGIPELAERDPEHLSGGQRQLVALAGVLAIEPAHLVLDEPTAMLDPAGTRLIGEAIAAVAAAGASILIAEQKTDLLAGVCGRVLVLGAGSIVLEGDAEAVLGDPDLESLGVEPPTSVRLERLARAGGVDPARVAVPS